MAIGIPVGSVFSWIAGDEPSNAGIVVAMTKQLQSAVTVSLVLLLPHEAEGCRRRACPTDRVAEGIEELAIGHTLAAIGDTPCASQRVSMIELGAAPSMLAQSRRVDRIAVFEERTSRTATIRDIVLRPGAVCLLGTQILAIVSEAVSRSARIREMPMTRFSVS